MDKFNVAYHEVEPNKLNDVLSEGLQLTSTRNKGDDQLIIRTDEFLDTLEPKSLIEVGLSRKKCIYTYIQIGTEILDITDGSLVPLPTFVSESEQAVLELHIDPASSYISDLDAYDELKDAIESNKPTNTLSVLAHTYWKSVVPLEDYEYIPGDRIEIMITQPVDPEDIVPLSNLPEII